MSGFTISFPKVSLGSVLFKNKRKILAGVSYGALIAFAIWFVTGFVMDYYSHIGVDIPISP